MSYSEDMESNQTNAGNKDRAPEDGFSWIAKASLAIALAFIVYVSVKDTYQAHRALEQNRARRAEIQESTRRAFDGAVESLNEAILRQARDKP